MTDTAVKELVARLDNFAEHLMPAADVYGDEMVTLAEAASMLTTLSEERDGWKSACMEARHGCNQRSDVISKLRAKLEAAESRATIAEARVLEVEKALEPFAAIEPTNIYSGDPDDPDAEADCILTENQFRFARSTLEAGE